jgi:hypothetical protein
VKNRNNDRSDASLQVDHLGDVHGSRSGARPPIREAITKNVYISPGSGSLDKNTHSFVYYFKKKALWLKGITFLKDRFLIPFYRSEGGTP